MQASTMSSTYFLGVAVACTALGVFNSPPVHAGSDQWTNLALPGTASAVAADPSHAMIVRTATLGGEVFTSTDGGANWTASYPGQSKPDEQTPKFYALEIHPDNGGVLLVGADLARVYVSTDGGVQWTRRRVEQDGASRQTINALEFIEPGGAAIAGTSNGIWENSNYSSGNWNVHPDWTGNGNVTSGCRYVYDVAVDPQDSSIRYAGTDCGLYKTDAQGRWQQATLQTQQIYAIEIDRELADTVYVATSGGVFRVTNGGTASNISYHSIAGPGIFDLAIDPTDSSIVYVGTPQGTYKGNPDGTGAWVPFNDGLGGQVVDSVAVSPADPHRVYAVASGDVYGIEQTYLPTPPHDVLAGYGTQPPASVSLRVNRGAFSGTVIVGSQGPADAQSVKFSLTFQKPGPLLRSIDAWNDVRVTRLQSTRGTCTISASKAICSLGNLSIGTAATISFTVEPLAILRLTTRASVSGATAGDVWNNTGDANGANNSAKANTTVLK
jgi:hypothetical protein